MHVWQGSALPRVGSRENKIFSSKSKVSSQLCGAKSKVGSHQDRCRIGASGLLLGGVRCLRACLATPAHWVYILCGLRLILHWFLRPCALQLKATSGLSVPRLLAGTYLP